MRTLAAAAALLLLWAGGARSAGDPAAAQTRRQLEAQLADWPQAPRRAAERMLAEYGLPDQATPRALIWNDQGPWKRIVVHRDAGRDVLEQVAAYHVPNERYAVIGRLPGNVSAERGSEELCSRAPEEALNFLSLNLADEVISGRRGAAAARAFYRRTAALAASGKSSPYTQSLLFAPASGATP